MNEYNIPPTKDRLEEERSRLTKITIYSLLLVLLCVTASVTLETDAICNILTACALVGTGAVFFCLSRREKYQRLTTAQDEDVAMWRKESARVLSYMSQVNTQKRELVYSEYVKLKHMAQEDHAEQVKRSLYSN